MPKGGRSRTVDEGPASSESSRGEEDAGMDAMMLGGGVGLEIHTEQPVAEAGGRVYYREDTDDEGDDPGRARKRSAIPAGRAAAPPSEAAPDTPGEVSAGPGASAGANDGTAADLAERAISKRSLRRKRARARRREQERAEAAGGQAPGTAAATPSLDDALESPREGGAGRASSDTAPPSARAGGGPAGPPAPLPELVLPRNVRLVQAGSAPRARTAADTLREALRAPRYFAEDPLDGLRAGAGPSDGGGADGGAPGSPAAEAKRRREAILEAAVAAWRPPPLRQAADEAKAAGVAPAAAFAGHATNVTRAFKDGNSLPSGSACFRCGRHGHLERYCNVTRWMALSPVQDERVWACPRCGKQHQDEDEGQVCRRIMSGTTCPRCARPGHLPSMCPLAGATGRPGPAGLPARRLCFLCGSARCAGAGHEPGRPGFPAPFPAACAREAAGKRPYRRADLARVRDCVTLEAGKPQDHLLTLLPPQTPSCPICGRSHWREDCPRVHDPTWLDAQSRRLTCLEAEGVRAEKVEAEWRERVRRGP